MRIRPHRFAAVPAACLVLALPLWAQGWVETFTPLDGSPYDSFGFALAGDADRLLVSSLGAEPVPQIQDCGAAYVFEHGPSGWVQTDRLDPSDPEHHMGFGWALELSGYNALVGAPRAVEAHQETGVVYAFRKLGAWTETQRVLGAGVSDNGLFGYSLSLDGTRLAVGAPRSDSAAGPDDGMVFVYEYSGTTWVQVAVLQGLPAETPQAFGHSVALEGGRLVVGAPTASSSIKDAGRIYVYENTSGLWTLTEVITDPEAMPHDRLGTRVQLQGDLIAAGQHYKDVDGVPDAGAVQIFQHGASGWAHRWTLGAEHPSPYLRYGYEVAFEGERLYATSPWAAAEGGGTGRVWVHGRSGSEWLQLPTFSPHRQGTPDGFGSSLAFAAGEVAFGRWGDSTGSTGVPGLGSVSTFDPGILPKHEAFCVATGCPCGNDGPEGGCLNSTGLGARLSALGTLSLERADLELFVDQLPASRMAVLLMGHSPSFSLLGDGQLCVSGGAGVLQLVGPPRFTGSGGVLGYELDDLGSLLPGVTRYLQVLYRDPVGPCNQGQNLSNALGLTFVP